MLPSYLKNLRIVEKYSDVNAEIIQFFEQNDPDFYPPISQRTQLTSFIELTFIHRGFIILFEKEGKIIGLAALCFENPIYQYYLHYIAVSKSQRGLGIGQQLIHAASYYVQKAGGSQLILTSWSSNVKAKKFYNKIGFVIIDILENDRSIGVHTYIFALDLVDGIITKPIAGMELIMEDQSSLEKVQRDFLGIDKEKSILGVFVHTPEKMQVCDGNFFKYEFFQPFAHRAPTHVLNLTYVHPALELTSDAPVEYVNLLDFCTRYLEFGTKNYLVIHESSSKIINKIDYPHLVYLDSSDELIVQKAIQHVFAGKDANEYTSDFLELTRQYGCNGLLIAQNSLSGMFNYSKMVEGLVVVDLLRDFAIHVASQRLKLHFSVDKQDKVN
jgi:GNAT superfamily N-acetyltransferase